MTMTALTDENDIHELRRRLEDAEETLRAIRCGEVDALVVEGEEGARIFTLQSADHPYRVLIEAMQQGAMSLSTDGTVLYCNTCLSEMLKTPHERIVGTSVDSLLPPSQRRSFELLFKTGRTGKSQGELDFQISGGSPLPVFVSFAPLSYDGFEAICMVVTDLTEQKKHQEMQEANRRKDEFLAMLAHELRNPLAPIQNAVVILKHLGFNDDNLIYASDIIERQTHHLSHLVDDLLDVSRITLGKVTLQKQPLEIASIITRAVETSRPSIDSRRHHLTLALPPKGVRVEADPTRLAQVIGNLLTNASKYMDEGGQIFLTTEQQDGQVIIRVRDTGIGISNELLPQVFDLFIQGDRSLARSEGGLGIGLTLVRRLVELHNGTVAVTSDGLGQGSEFIVQLPALAQSETSDERESKLEMEFRSINSRRILIVEDNKDGADTLAMLLRMMGHEVSVAYSGVEGIRMAETLPLDVILLDIGLPGMNGYEVASQLRKLPGFRDTVFIAMTGYGQDEDRQRSLAAGFNHHLVKPVDPTVLKRLLESFC